MSIISKDLIENVQAKDMQQIFKMNPTTQEAGLPTNNGEAQASFIRGFQVSIPIINGIPFTSLDTSDPMMYDIERVEIINGATGFLYGGGRVGGAVNYITKKPTTQDLRNITMGSYGNDSYYSNIDLGGQFDEDNTFGYRINGFYQNGELPNETEKEQKALSLVFDWKPTDNFYTDIKYSHNDILRKGSNTYFYFIDDRKSIDTNKISGPDWLQNKMKLNKIENSINWDINDILSLRTNLFYEEMKIKRSSFPILYLNNQVNTSTSYSKIMNTGQDKNENYGTNIFLDSKFDTGNISHTLTTGYSLSSRKYYFANYGYATIPFIGGINGLKNLSEPSVWMNSNGTSMVNLDESPKLNSKLQYKNILIGDDIVFNDNWSALVGVNYASIISTRYSNGVQSSKYDVSEATPTLSLIFKPFEKLTTYVTYIESLEAGTIVGTKYANMNEILDPYVSKQYEVGAKYSMLDEKALLTATLFRLEKANKYEIPTTPKPTLTRDGEEIHQGLEIGLTGKVTDNLTIMGGVTFMDLSVEKATNPALEGKKPTNVATKMAKLFAEYQIPYINGLFINAGAYHTGKRYADSLNTDILPSYTLYDIGLRYKTKLDKFRTTFNLTVQNLTDEVYWIYDSDLGNPRAVAFSMKMEF